MANNQKKYASLTTLQAIVNNIKSLFATKEYTDNAVAQKTQVQFITWEADD